MKLLTVCIPCHNSIENMHKSITSCLLMKEEVEVIIIDDHSTDETLQVAKEYEALYPDMIQVIENHDDFFLKKALDHSHGLYFKILKSGDFFDQPSLVSVIETLRDFIRIQANLDLLITDHKCVSEGKRNQKMSYRNIFPTETLFEWHGLKAFKKHFQIDLQAMIIKTSILKNIRDIIKNDEFMYVYLIYGMIPHIKSMYYLQTYFYCCSEKKETQIHELDQYIVLLKNLWNAYSVYSLKSRRQRHFAIEQLSRIYIAIEYLVFKNNEKEKKNELDLYLQDTNPKLFKAVTNNLFGTLLNFKNETAQNMLNRLFDKIYDNYHI